MALAGEYLARVKGFLQSELKIGRSTPAYLKNNAGTLQIQNSGEGYGDLTKRWTGVSFSRASDSTATVTDNATNQAIFIAGRPLRYRATGGTWRYGLVVSYSSGAVTLDGHPLSTSDDDEMQWGQPEQVRVINVIMPGNCVVADPYSATMYWQQGQAFCVRSTWKADTAPTGANLLGNIEINGSDLHGSEITISSTSEVDSGVDITAANYDINFGETVAVTVSQVGSTIPGGNPLTVTLAFILP